MMLGTSSRNWRKVFAMAACMSHLPSIPFPQPFPEVASYLPTTSVPDGKVCLNEQGELAVTKFAVEPVDLP